MKADYYVDVIMGEWGHDRKQSNKDCLVYVRRASVVLHKDHAMPYTDPGDFKDYKVYGEVVLTEKKLIDVKSSAPSYFRGLELTPKSSKDLVI